MSSGKKKKITLVEYVLTHLPEGSTRHQACPWPGQIEVL